MTVWNPEDLPEPFFARVRKWHTGIRDPLVKALKAFPSLAPTDIFIDDEDPHGEEEMLWSPEDWSLLCSLGSLKHLRLWRLRSTTFLLGLPQNLDSFSVDLLMIDGLEAGSLALLPAILASIPHTKLSLSHQIDVPEVEPDDPILRRYLVELGFWEKVRGFSCEGLKVDWETLKGCRALLGIES